tara:strand:- start:10326 stop:10688 length:363 start_codon:yes stop_codon:yes gene_type:complete
MDVKLRYTGGEDYDVSEDFLESISEIDFTTAIKIARNIGNGWVTLPHTNMVSHVLGGVVEHDGEYVTYALELLRLEDDFILLTDIKLIEMDEYLDLINLNLYIKTDEYQHTEDNSTEEHS